MRRRYVQYLGRSLMPQSPSPSQVDDERRQEDRNDTLGDVGASPMILPQEGGMNEMEEAEGGIDLDASVEDMDASLEEDAEDMEE